MDTLPGASLADWDKWAKDQVVGPVVKGVEKVVFAPFSSLSNLKMVQAAALINNPSATIRQRLAITDEHLQKLKFYRVLTTIRDCHAPAIAALVGDYLERLSSIELAVTSLLGRRLPVVEAIFNDLKTLLGGSAAKTKFPAAPWALLDEISGAFEQMLSDLKIVAGKTGASGNSLDLAPGHFYDWLCCITDVDNAEIKGDEQRRKQQQRLRHTMMKVILAYVDDVDISPSAFKASAQPEVPAKTSGGFPVSSTGANAILSNASGSIRAYAGLFAAAFEHVFVSARPLANTPDAAGLYHDLPLTLKLQRPDLFKTACATPRYSSFPDLEANSEFLAMRLATTSANVAAGTVRTTINCIGNGIWEISPNNPPLVDTIAQFIAIPIYELEKAIVYDLLRRFRVYVTDQPPDLANELMLMYATMNVPDFSGSGKTEKPLTAVVAVACEDKTLLQGARQVLGDLPIRLDDVHPIDQQSDIARLLHGFMKDSLAAAYLFNS